jgi:hypothetical protein
MAPVVAQAAALAVKSSMNRRRMAKALETILL